VPNIDTTPAPFLEVLIHRPADEPGLAGLCVCYELGAWRADAFSRHLFEWLPEFALTWAERQTFSDGTSVALLRRAAAVVYDTMKYERRGEFGELILHAIIRQLFDSEPAISKIFFKDAANDTVKGFDAVHVVDAEEGLELWLGEAKFYKDFNAACTAVVAELAEHFKTDYLRSEFMLISNKLDNTWRHADTLKQLLHPNVSLDKVFKRIVVPVLVTYDSETVRKFTEHSAGYVEDFAAEIDRHWKTFADRVPPITVRIRLLLLPLKDKSEFATMMHDRLQSWPNI
jgi:uncharacterized protein DUF1837